MPGPFGLGTMGSALALDILEKGLALHVANRTAAKVEPFLEEARGLAPRRAGRDGPRHAGPRAVI